LVHCIKSPWSKRSIKTHPQSENLYWGKFPFFVNERAYTITLAWQRNHTLAPMDELARPTSIHPKVKGLMVANAALKN
jgi:hypothetical protein